MRQSKSLNLLFHISGVGNDDNCTGGTLDASGKKKQTAKLAWAIGGRYPSQTVKQFDFPHMESLTGKYIKGLLTSQWLPKASYGIPSFSIAPDECNPFASGETLKALCKQALMSMNRYEFLDMLELGKSAYNWLVLDRYFVSGLAYGLVDGLPMDYLVNIHRCLPQPELSILIDIPVAESVRRRPVREDDHEADLPFLENVRQTYLELFNSAPPRFLGHRAVVSGIGTEDEVHQRIMNIFDNLYDYNKIRI